VANKGDSDVTVLLGNGKGQFNVGRNYAVSGGNLAVAVADFNGEGKPDLAVTGTAASVVSVLLNLGGGRFAASQDFHTGEFTSYVAVADFNQDGKSDLATTDFENGLQVSFGKGDGTFGAPVMIATGLSYVVAADFNGDGIPDIAATSDTNSNDVTVILNNGDGTFQKPKTFFAGPVVNWLTVGDFNGDGKLDLAVTAGNFVVVLLGNGDGTFQSPIDTSLPNAYILTTADFNGDGKLDLAVTNLSGDVSILLGKGDGTFGKPRSFAAGVQLFDIVAGDFRGNGKVDIAVADNFWTANSVNVLLGNGDGTFGKPTSYPVGTTPTTYLSPSSIVMGDFNLDGKVDLAVAALGGNAFVLFGKGDGSFQPAKQVGPGAGGWWIAGGDFNGDGKPDLVVADYGEDRIGGGVSVLLNVTKKKAQ
jgi:hypothetical protein